MTAKQSAYDRAKDSSAANDGASTKPRQLFCAAHGCPNLWSTSVGHVCRWHAEADPERWPEVTQQQQWDETERARLRGMPKPYAEPPTHEEKREILQRLRTVFDPKRDPKGWAKRLRAQHRRGEKLHGTVLTMARAALFVHTEPEA
jgi:hypothetical protein